MTCGSLFEHRASSVDVRTHIDLFYRCKYLRRISTTIGEEPFLPNSHVRVLLFIAPLMSSHLFAQLFDFDDLRQLSLTASCNSLDWLVGKPIFIPLVVAVVDRVF